MEGLWVRFASLRCEKGDVREGRPGGRWMGPGGSEMGSPGTERFRAARSSPQPAPEPAPEPVPVLVSIPVRL
ncbi:hypothetical protein GN956_G10036 [Arapaima gigas]